MKFIKLCLILFAISAFIFACTETGKNEKVENINKAVTNEPKAEATATPDELAEGRKHYKEQCSKCHKDDGKGGEIEIEGKKIKPDNLTTEKMAKETDEEYIEYMTEGIPDEGMPSFKDVLSKEEMQEVVKYIRTEFQGKKE